jgi:hypothetical protein
MSLVRYLIADVFDPVPNVGNSAACPVNNMLARPSSPVSHALSSAAGPERQSAGHSS